MQAYNREQEGARKYILAAEDERDMKTWMNVLSLASIAFGSGKASMAKPTTAPPRLADDHDRELELMQKRAAERAGGVRLDLLPVVSCTVPWLFFLTRRIFSRSLL